MAIDTIACTKHLQADGVRREEVEAHAEPLTRRILPDLATKADLEQGLERLKHNLTVRMFGLVLGIVGVMNGILFALIKIVP